MQETRPNRLISTVEQRASMSRTASSRLPLGPGRGQRPQRRRALWALSRPPPLCGAASSSSVAAGRLDRDGPCDDASGRIGAGGPVAGRHPHTGTAASPYSANREAVSRMPADGRPAHLATTAYHTRPAGRENPVGLLQPTFGSAGVNAWLLSAVSAQRAARRVESAPPSSAAREPAEYWYLLAGVDRLNAFS